MRKQVIILFGVINCFSAIYAQGEIDLQPKVYYRNEWSLAAMLNSNGIGANYRYGKRIDAANKRLYEVDFAYMKDPKESKTYVDPSLGNARYIHGKKNHAFDFRFALGKQHEMFRKHDLGGIAVRYFYNYGPSVVLLKPIYYNVGKWENVPNNPNYQYWVQFSKPEKFDPLWESNNVRIASRASFFKGFNELRALPGAFAKFGFNFDFSRQDRVVHALEAGIIAEGFLKKIEIMDCTYLHSEPRKVAQNQQFFLTLFVSYRFGRIVDPFEVKKKRERTKEISY